MKFTDILRGYIPPTDERRREIWKQADFVFDTNILLDVYRYTDTSRAGFFKLLAALKGRVFVPNRVAVEFARNRQGVIRAHFGPQRIIKAKLDDAAKDIDAKHPKHPLRDHLRKLIDSAKNLVDQEFGEAEKKHNSLVIDDNILRELLAIIGEDVADPYPQNEIDKEYKRRKDGLIPPFCKIDDHKDEVRQVGDVVIWLEMPKKYEGTSKPVVFVTDDTKENWWHDLGGGRKEAQPSLVQEMYERSKADILFYSSERFSGRAPDYLGVDVPRSLAEETKKIREEEKSYETVIIDYFRDAFPLGRHDFAQGFPVHQSWTTRHPVPAQLDALRVHYQDRFAPMRFARAGWTVDLMREWPDLFTDSLVVQVIPGWGIFVNGSQAGVRLVQLNPFRAVITVGEKLLEIVEE